MTMPEGALPPDTEHHIDTPPKAKTEQKEAPEPKAEPQQEAKVEQRAKVAEAKVAEAETEGAESEEPEIEAAEIEQETAAHLALGRRGEELAALYLERLGYQLVAANVRLPVGRNLRGALVRAELDLVAYEGRTLCFVEVKTRASDWFAAPEANVDLRKQRQLSRAARVYKRLFGLTGAPHRYDVLSVIIPPTDDAATTHPRLRLLRNFWTDEKFRKRRWSGPDRDF